MSSYLRYGAHPYIVVVRENSREGAVEHRFVGLFTVAAMNANVLEIPLISRLVNDALAMAHRDPVDRRWQCRHGKRPGLASVPPDAALSRLRQRLHRNHLQLR